MSGRPKGAKRPLGCPLDGGVRPHCSEAPLRPSSHSAHELEVLWVDLENKLINEYVRQSAQGHPLLTAKAKRSWRSIELDRDEVKDQELLYITGDAEGEQIARHIAQSGVLQEAERREDDQAGQQADCQPDETK